MVVVLGSRCADREWPPLCRIMIMVSIRHFLMVVDQSFRGQHPDVLVGRVLADGATGGVSTTQPRHGVWSAFSCPGFIFAATDAQLSASHPTSSQSGGCGPTLSRATLFASAETFMAAFDFKEAVERVVIECPVRRTFGILVRWRRARTMGQVLQQ
jgi:SulP family sulfate permease